MDFKKAFELFKENHPGWSDTTMRLYLNDVGGLMNFVGPDTDVDSITVQDVIHWGETNAYGLDSWRRRIYALKAFFDAVASENPLDGYSARTYGFEWTYGPIPPRMLLTVLSTHNISSVRIVRTAACVNLVYAGLGLQEITQLLVSDVQLEMGLVANERGIFPLALLGKAALEKWLEARPQLGTNPSLMTTSDGSGVISSVYLGHEISAYLKSATGTKYTHKNILASRYLADVLQIGCDTRKLTGLWGTSAGLTLSILKYLVDGGSIIC